MVRSKVPLDNARYRYGQATRCEDRSRLGTRLVASKYDPEITNQLLTELPVVGGIAVLEDQHDDTTLIEGVPPEGFSTVR